MMWHTSSRTADTLLWIGMAAAVAFATLALSAARNGIFDLDRGTQALVGLTRSSSLHGPMATLSLLGQATGLVPAIAMAQIISWRCRRRWAVALPIVMAGTWGLETLGKWAVDRPRPNGAAWGFPSGHTFSVVVLFGVIAYLVCTSGAGQRWRWTAVTTCGVLALGVAFSRLYLDMHWLSDVGGGFAVGLAYLPLAIWCVELAPARASAASPATAGAGIEG
ncbi:MAG TPA: phosphatase PAP2 family protein [Methylomirabilota bacterium]|jgi:undecaprenyl-diphosphatase